MLTDNKPGQKELLMGNQAVVRGAIEAGMQVAATYPGTPASEIGDTFSEKAKTCGYYFEYSTNEKLAFETALAGSWSNLRSIVSMKHVGLNVAADALMSSTYGGTIGGMVLVIGDDPSFFSSQNEQDSRNYAVFAHIPCLEPTCPQDTKEMVKYAFDLSEQFHLPVMIRLTTRTAHCSGSVEFSDIKDNTKQPLFTRDKLRKAALPAHAYQLHPDLMKRFQALEDYIETSQWIKMELKGKKGIIANGLTMNYVKEVLKYENLDDISLLWLGFTNPLPKKTIETFLRHCDQVLVAEELDPLTEKTVKNIAFDQKLSVDIHGKDLIPSIYELNTSILQKAISGFLNRPSSVSFTGTPIPFNIIPPRYPVLCPGCPHRATFYAIKRVFPKAVYPSDIGCYTLGLQPPLNAVDTCVCMGASIGLGAAFSKFLPEKVVCTIGDSTFFHTGLPALANAVYNQSKLTVVLVDNSITAMTGQQPCPSCGLNSLNEPTIPILPEKIAEAMGIEMIRIVNPLHVQDTITTLKEVSTYDKTSFIVSRSPCCMIEGKKDKRVFIDPDKCNGCAICVKTFGCPPLTWNEDMKKTSIDESLCNGCGACIEICPQHAIM
ncbi:indolepyruvate ferredoxin oxidoreductase subunit alpha [bacterium]|nr:indolepyruvate ferredoxin oxidoreductase subunit alpha [bacterium]